MSVVFNTAELRDGLNWVNAQINPKAAVLENSYVIIDPVKDGTVTLAGGEGSSEAMAKISASGELDTQIGVQAASMLMVARSAPADTVTMTLTDKGVTFKSGSAKFNLPVCGTIENAHMSDMSKRDKLPDVKVEINGEDLANLVSAVTPFAADDPTNPALQGVEFQVKDEKLRLVATDSRTLAAAWVKAPGATEARVTILARALRSVAKSFPADETVKVRWEGDKPRRMTFSTKSRVFTTGTIIDVPSGDSLLATKPDTLVTAPTKELAQLMGRAANAVHGSADTVVVSVPTEDNWGSELEVTAHGQVITHEESLNVEASGPSVQRGLSSKAIVNALRNATSEKVTLGFTPKIMKLSFESPLDVTVLTVLQPV